MYICEYKLTLCYNTIQKSRKLIRQYQIKKPCIFAADNTNVYVKSM